MVSMDVFNSNAFSMTSLTGVVNEMAYVPQLLGSLGIFDSEPVRTRTVYVDRRPDKLALIPTSPVLAPPKQLTEDLRNAVPLKTTRLAKAFTLYAEEVQGIRASGSETELQTVQGEYARKAAKLMRDMELTKEYHRLGALQGKLLDADGTTVIYDYFDEFGVAEPAAIDFALADDTTDIRAKCRAVIRQMTTGSKGAISMGTTIHAIVGDGFFDALVTHPNVEKFYLGTNAANNAAETQGPVYESFTFGGITFHNYRGTDEASPVSIGQDDARFFPVGATDVFKQALAPAEFGPYVNTPGQEFYMMNLTDPSGREAYVSGEIYSYPLFLCQRPEALATATA